MAHILAGVAYWFLTRPDVDKVSNKFMFAIYLRSTGHIADSAQVNKREHAKSCWWITGFEVGSSQIKLWLSKITFWGCGHSQCEHMPAKHIWADVGRWQVACSFPKIRCIDRKQNNYTRHMQRTEICQTHEGTQLCHWSTGWIHVDRHRHMPMGDRLLWTRESRSGPGKVR